MTKWAGESTDDAEGALSRLLVAMADELVVAKNRLALVKKEEARLHRQLEVAAKMVAEWRQRAMSAVRAGDDVVAKEALVQTREHEHAAANLRATHDGHVQELERAKADLAEQSRSLEDAKQKKSALLVRAKRLNQSEWLTALVGAGAGRPAEVLERAAAMLDTLEREARIERELGDPVLVPKKPLAKTSSDREERAEARPARRTKR